MNRTSHTIMVLATACALMSAAPSRAQIVGVPGNPALTVPLPPAPPPPRIEVPVVPKLGDLPRQQNAPQPRGSFSDRMTNCLHDGAAAGLGPNDRATYSRACANR